VPELNLNRRGVLSHPRRAVLQNLREEICECLRRAEESKRLAKTALTRPAIQDYLEMERRWLSLARSCEFAERLSRFVEPLRKRTPPEA
jgi:hypothetical protein